LSGEGLEGDGSREDADSEYVDGGGVGRVWEAKKLSFTVAERDASVR
jgi:hypothetical protein